MGRSVAAAFALGGLVVLAACGSSKTPTSSGVPPLPVGQQTDHFVFHYAAGNSVNASWEETYHVWATGRLGVTLSQKIGYYRYESRQDMGDHTGNYSTNGFADPARMEINTLWSTDNHEVVHLYMSTFGQSTSLFAEGIAVAFQTDPATGDFRSVFNGVEVHQACRGYLASGELVLPLDRIIENSGFRAVTDSTLSYREAGSFVRFLIDRYGLDRFIAFYKSGVTLNDTKDAIKPRFASAMGVSFEDAEAAWLDFLRTGE